MVRRTPGINHTLACVGLLRASKWHWSVLGLMCSVVSLGGVALLVGVNVQAPWWWMTVIYFYGLVKIPLLPPESPPQDLTALWRRFSRSPSQGEKNKIMNSNSPIMERENTHTHTRAHCWFTFFWSHTLLVRFLHWTYGNVSLSHEISANVRPRGWNGPGPHVNSSCPASSRNTGQACPPHLCTYLCLQPQEGN